MNLLHERSVLERGRFLLRRKRSLEVPRLVVILYELSPVQILATRLVIAAMLFLVAFGLLWWWPSRPGGRRDVVQRCGLFHDDHGDNSRLWRYRSDLHARQTA